MNTVADTTRTLGREASSIEIRRATPRGATRGLARKIADWWADDPMSEHFTAERERDQRMLRRAR
jgi:hypothetical protein